MDRIRKLVEFAQRVYPYVQQGWKAVTATYAAAVAQYVLARQTDGVSKEEWAYLVVTSVAVGLGVWFKRNVPMTSSG